MCNYLREGGNLLYLSTSAVSLLSNKLYFLDIPTLILRTQPSSNSNLTLAPDHHQSSVHCLLPEDTACRNPN